MIILEAATKTLELVLSGAVATNQLPFVSNYVSFTTTAFAGIEQDGVSNGATPVTIVSAPVPPIAYQVKFITVRNSDTAPVTVTIQLNNNGTTRILVRITLAIGSTLQYTDGEGFSVLDSNGNIIISQATAITSLTTDVVAVGPGAAVATIQPDAITTAKIINDAVTFAKMQDIATDRLLGRETAASGNIEEISLGGGLLLESGTLKQSALINLAAVASGGHSPADSTTYYFGEYFGFNPGPLPLTAIPVMTRAGRATRVSLRFFVFGTLASTETFTVSLYNNTAATSQDITTTMQLNAASNGASSTAMSLAFSAGDTFPAIRFVTPAWATNPTVVVYNATVEVIFD